VESVVEVNARIASDRINARFEVVSATWNDMPNATPRVRDIAGVARDDVKMQVVNGLTCCLPGIEAKVVAIRAMDLIDDSLHL
jgi:hypothetical protein